jgi:hypothetical protein
MCIHLQARRDPWIAYVKWYVGAGLNAHLLCIPCADLRAAAQEIRVIGVCQECYEFATTEVGNLRGVRGTPQVILRPEPFDNELLETSLPSSVGAIVDVAPIDSEGRSIWLILAEGGGIFRMDADSHDCLRVASTSFIAEPNHKPFAGHDLRQRLHASSDGEFAAVVNDYGRHGRVLHVRTGNVTMEVDGGQYHPETVPFSFAFANAAGRVVAIHRTSWNRLDVSDPATGRLLTERELSPPQRDRRLPLPEHYLDYFHGALHVSPGGDYILDDGWVWHPVGVPSVWSLHSWITTNPWESEDGPSKIDVCARENYWDHGVAWLDDTRVAIERIGDDSGEMIAGARIFDVTLRGKPGPLWRADWEWARELAAFAGPTGAFFSDGHSLFSSDHNGLSRWDPQDGARTAHLAGFTPGRYHRGANELMQRSGRALTRLRIGAEERS